MSLDLPKCIIMVQYSEHDGVVAPKDELTPIPCHSLAGKWSWGEILATPNTKAKLH